MVIMGSPYPPYILRNPVIIVSTNKVAVAGGGVVVNFRIIWTKIHEILVTMKPLLAIWTELVVWVQQYEWK